MTTRWTIVSTWSAFEILRAPPFDAIDLDLSLLWEVPSSDAG